MGQIPMIITTTTDSRVLMEPEEFRLRGSFIYHSNRLDGITISAQETADLMQGGMALRQAPDVVGLDGKTFDVGVVLGHIDALENIHEIGIASEPITPAHIQGIHRRLMEGILLSNGEFRECVLTIKGIPPFPTEGIPDALEALCTFMNTPTDKPVETSWRVHHEFLAIHPFIEGNGRMARLMLNLIRLRNGLGLQVLRVDDHPRYAKAILSYMEFRQNSTSD